MGSSSTKKQKRLTYPAPSVTACVSRRLLPHPRDFLPSRRCLDLAKETKRKMDEMKTDKRAKDVLEEVCDERWDLVSTETRKFLVVGAVARFDYYPWLNEYRFLEKRKEKRGFNDGFGEEDGGGGGSASF